MIFNTIKQPALICLAALLLPISPARAEESAARQTYTKVKEKYQSMTSFTAAIESDITITETSSYKMSGLVATEPPRKWAIYLTAEQKDGKAKLMLLDMFDGSTQWTYNPKTAELQSKTIKEDDKGKQPDRKFFPAFELYRDETLTVIKEDAEQLILQLASDKPSSLFHFVRLNIKKKTQLVEVMEFLDARKKVRISVVFSAINTSDDIDDRSFTPTDTEEKDPKKLVARLKEIRKQEK